LRFAQQRGLRGVWLRLFGLYGPQETAPSMLPWLARQFAEGRRPQLTACTQAWDYLHVRDGARAVADVVESDAEGLFNLASGHAPPLRETVRMLRDVMAPQIEPDFGAVPFGPEQVHCLAGDVARLQAATGWAAQIPLEQGLAELALEAFDGLAS
jgi:nucleoside-diphosphate-sugar epimerase